MVYPDVTENIQYRNVSEQIKNHSRFDPWQIRRTVGYPSNYKQENVLKDLSLLVQSRTGMTHKERIFYTQNKYS